MKANNKSFEKKWDMVKYSNDFAKVSWEKLNAFEMDILAVMLVALRSTNKDVVTIDLKRLEKLMGRRLYRTRIAEQLDRMTEKLQDIKARAENETWRVTMVIFPTIGVDSESTQVSLRLNPDFKDYFNCFDKGFVKWELADHLRLSNSYAKSLYRHLCSFKRTGVWSTSVEEFRRLMTVPEKYDNRRMIDNIVKPSVKRLKEELPSLFSTLAFGTTKNGRSIDGLIFAFEPFENNAETDYDFLSFEDEVPF